MVLLAESQEKENCKTWNYNFLRLSLGKLYTLVNGATAKKPTQILALEALERDLERGKPFFRRKRVKTRYLASSGHKGLADSNIKHVSHFASSSVHTLFVCVRGRKIG